MVVANKTSRYCWAYETVPGTAEIVAIDTTCYYFGEYNEECGDWNTAFVENASDAHWVYSVRTPSLTDLNTEYPTFSHVFLPTSVQPYSWILKKPATATPMTVVALETGLTSPLTIRHEEGSGTNPMLTQAVGCYCVGLMSKAERGKELMVEATFAWQSIEDQGDRSHLTTAPLKPAGEAANEITGTYEGNPEIVWDVGGHNHSIAGVWKAEWSQPQEYESVDSDAGVTQTVYTYKYKPVEIILNAVFETTETWDDYIDRKAATVMTIKLWKHDRTHYILGTFTNCRLVNHRKTGHRNKGHYNSVCAMLAEKVEYSANWLAEYDGADGDFTDHFKAGV